MRYLIIILLGFLIIGCSSQKVEFFLVKEGVVESVEYLQSIYLQPSRTIINFSDKSNFIIKYVILSIPSREIQIFEKRPCSYIDCYIIKPKS